MRSKFVVAEDQPGTWQWRLVDEDGEDVGRSAGSFTSPLAAERAAESARALASSAAVTSARDAAREAPRPAPEPEARAVVPPEPEPPEQSMNMVFRRLVQASRARAQS
jgi:hypothetical protein